MIETVRTEFVTQALESYPELGRLINDLSGKEVLHALDIESRTRRRQSILDRLIARAVRLNEIHYQQQLKEKYHGSPRIEDPQRQERSRHLRVRRSGEGKAGSSRKGQA